MSSPGDSIEDKNKVGLLYTGMGVLVGIISGILSEILFPESKFINFAIYAMCIALLYLGIHLLPRLKVDMEKQGKWWKIMGMNLFSFVIAWAVVWSLIHELVRY